MSKLWIACITQNEEKNIYELIDTFGGFNDKVGGVFVDGHSTDETAEVIRNWGGHVLKRRWTADHYGSSGLGLPS